jgi:lambda family phage portal protein
LTLQGIEKTRARKIIDGFNAWNDSADASGRLGAADQQRLTLRSAARDGETLVRFLRGSEYPDGLGLLFMESDYLDQDMTRDNRDGSRIIGGVEVDSKTGRAIAYHLFESHPGDTTSGISTRTRRVPAEDLLHLFRAERPGQTRAVSWIASSMKTLRMLYGYLEAELVAARISSCKMGFYKIPPGEDFQSDDKNEAISDAAPGVFERMPTGWDFVPYDPQHPNAAAGNFVKTILRQMAGGLGVAYNNFANDLDGVSYSSIRSGSLEEREQWKVIQQWFSRNERQRIFSEWVKTAAITGKYGLRAGDVDEIIAAARWTGRRWAWVDPQSDLAAKKDEISFGLTAPQVIAAENGADYETNLELIKEANEARQIRGLSPIGSNAAAVQDTALNGAQIQAVAQILAQAASGQIPKEVVAPLLAASFPSLDEAEIAKITAPLKTFTAQPKAAGA